MYIVTRKESLPIAYQDLGQAVQEAVKQPEPLCWIWKVEVTRLGTLKRIEVAREEIEATGIDGIFCIRNRSGRDQTEPIDGQVYFATIAGKLEFLVYRREENGKEVGI